MRRDVPDDRSGLRSRTWCRPVPRSPPATRSASPPSTSACPRRSTGARPEPVMSSIAKRAVADGTTLWLSPLNLAGDAQADLTVHGGPDKAVYAYPSEHLPWWSEELGEDLGPAPFGENLSTIGVTEDDVGLGDVWSWGEALLEVCQPRTPCFKLALHRRASRHAGAVLGVGPVRLVPPRPRARRGSRRRSDHGRSHAPQRTHHRRRQPAPGPTAVGPTPTWWRPWSPTTDSPTTGVSGWSGGPSEGRPTTIDDACGSVIWVTHSAGVDAPADDAPPTGAAPESASWLRSRRASSSSRDPSLPAWPDTGSRRCSKDSRGIDRDTVGLLVSELVTNAVIHAGSTTQVHVVADDDRYVSRSAIGRRHHRWSGRSIVRRSADAVSASSTRWLTGGAFSDSTRRAGPGKIVWFELDRRPAD